MKILELGSGHGEVMAQLCDFGYEVEAIDKNPTFFGERKLDIYEVGNFFKEKFEMVLLQMPLGLDMEKVINNVLDVLEKDGVFYVITEKNEVIKDLNQYWGNGEIRYGIRKDIPLSFLAQTIEVTNVGSKVKGIQYFL